MKLKRWVVFVGALALVVAACGGGDTEATTTTADSGAPETTAAPDTTEGDTDTTQATETTEGTASGEPIIIGAAIDQTQDMAPFNNPANTAAQIMVDRINEAGGVDGRPLELITRDTTCLLYTSPSPRDQRGSRMPSSA